MVLCDSNALVACAMSTHGMTPFSKRVRKTQLLFAEVVALTLGGKSSRLLQISAAQVEAAQIYTINTARKASSAPEAEERDSSGR
eukprot:2215669-Rhodomonas_salina.1